MGKNAQKRRASREVRRILRRLQGGSRYLRPESDRWGRHLETRREAGEFIPNRAMRRGTWSDPSSRGARPGGNLAHNPPKVKHGRR